MNLLHTIPPNIRSMLYWGGYILGVLSSGITAVWGSFAAASPDVEMPISLVITQAVVVLLVTQLNLLAGSNVSAPGEAVLFDDRDERGSADSHGILKTLYVMLIAAAGYLLVWGTVLSQR